MRKLTLEARRDGWVGRVVTVAATIRKMREREREREKTIFTRGNVSGSYEHNVCIKLTVFEEAVCCLQTKSDTVTTFVTQSVYLLVSLLAHRLKLFYMFSQRSRKFSGIADGTLWAVDGSALPRR